jgi:NAD+ diphosphatase
MIPFAGNPLNRSSEKRTDAAWIESRRRDPSSLILPMCRLEPFLLEPRESGATTELGLVRPEIVDSLAGAEATCIFLGLDGDRAVFALDVSAAADPANAGSLAGLGYFRDARTAAQMVSIKDTAILGTSESHD